jgi:hypothetical protein
VSDDRRLVDAYEELLAARAPSSRDACPPPEALLALVERQGDEDARLATLDHTMSCASCRRDLDLLRAATAAAGEKAPDASGVIPLPIGRRAGRRAAWAPLAAAAGIVLVVGVGVLSRGSREAPSTLRGGAAAVLLAPPERVAGGAVMLRWHRVADAPRYRVEVFAPSGATVAEAIVVDTTFTLPAAAFAGRPDSLRWTVTALRPDGGELRSTMGRLVP